MGKRDSAGRPPKYSAPKSRTTLSITLEGLEGLDRLAESLGLSRSELVELIGRGDFLVIHKDEALRRGIRECFA